MEVQEREITIEYLNLQGGDVGNGLLGEAFMGEKMDAVKVKALTNLGIEHTEDTPLKSWLRYLSELNGLEFTQPAHVDLVDAIQFNPTAFKFMFWLA